MKQWTKGNPQSSALVDAEQFNTEYDTHKGTFNGGLDRTALTGDWCNRTHLKSNAMHMVDLTDLAANTKFTETASGVATTFSEVQYDEYGGGWVNTNITETLTNLKDGMAHIEVKGSFHLNQYYQATKAQTLRIRLMLNNVPIVAAGYFTQTMQSFRITADTPIPAGTSELVLQWRMNAKNTAIPAATPVMHLFGVQILSIVRWR